MPRSPVHPPIDAYESTTFPQSEPVMAHYDIGRASAAQPIYAEPSDGFSIRLGMQELVFFFGLLQLFQFILMIVVVILLIVKR